MPGASHLVRDARPGRIRRAASPVRSLRKVPYSNSGDFVSHPNNKFTCRRPLKDQYAARLLARAAVGCNVGFGSVTPVSYPRPQ